MESSLESAQKKGNTLEEIGRIFCNRKKKKGGRGGCEKDDNDDDIEYDLFDYKNLDLWVVLLNHLFFNPGSNLWLSF